MGYIISVFTNKGGVAKTTTTLSLGHALAIKGVKTLIADIDSQCNSSEPFFGVDPRNNLMDVFTDTASIDKCVRPLVFQENLFCLPNTSAFGTLEPKLMRMGADGFMVFKEKARDFCKNNFDITIIDCPPGYGIMTMNALVAADLAIVPVEAGSRNAIRGLMTALEVIDDIKKDANIGLRFLKLLITKLDKRTTIGKNAVSQLKASFPDHTFETCIPINVDFLYSEEQRKTIFQSNPGASGADAYSRLADEVCAILGHAK